MKALQQGELDCLCGIYSIVNAVYFVSNKKIKRKPLFNKLLLAYMNNWGIYELLTSGLDIEQMKYLLNYISRLYPNINIKYPKPRKEKVYPLISSHLSLSNAIVLFSTEYHWSLINGFQKNKFSLFDSCGTKTISIEDILANSIFLISFLP